MDEHYPLNKEQEELMIIMFHACKKATDELYRNVTPKQQKYYKQRLAHHISHMDTITEEMTMWDLKNELTAFLSRDLKKVASI